MSQPSLPNEQHEYSSDASPPIQFVRALIALDIKDFHAPHVEIVIAIKLLNMKLVIWDHVAQSHSRRATQRLLMFRVTLQLLDFINLNHDLDHNFNYDLDRKNRTKQN